MVRKAAELFRRQGYAATGWRQIVAESKTPWGSQAHHFPDGKAQLAVEAVARSGAAYERLLRAALADVHPAAAIRTWAAVAADELERSDWADGCPIATLALETAHDSDTLAHACAIAFRSWRAALVDAFTARGVDPSEGEALAGLVLAGIEGALLLARVERERGPLLLVGEELARVLESHVP
jgi:TetR/AcrR family transcriptional repressor of lmrAB and yxaGH operons